MEEEIELYRLKISVKKVEGKEEIDIVVFGDYPCYLTESEWREIVTEVDKAIEKVKFPVLGIISKYKSGDTLSREDAVEIMKYCAKTNCELCILRKKFGKCPLVISLP